MSPARQPSEPSTAALPDGAGVGGLDDPFLPTPAPSAFVSEGGSDTVCERRLDATIPMQG